jgi:serine O-acetyltransferase
MDLSFSPSRKEFELFLDAQLRLVRLEFADGAAQTDGVYAKLARVFPRIRNKYYNEANGPILRVAHNGQYTIFLYELSRALFEAGAKDHADKIYALLRIASAADIYYEVKLPDFWCCDHPLGSVIGRGQFAKESALVFSQNCNIGNNRGVYPRINGKLQMMPNSSLLGDCIVEGNVILANGSLAMDAGTLSNCIVFGRSPDLIVKPLDPQKFEAAYMLRVS